MRDSVRTTVSEGDTIPSMFNMERVQHSETQRSSSLAQNAMGNSSSQTQDTGVNPKKLSYSQPGLAISAATALAGAVSRRQQSRGPSQSQGTSQATMGNTFSNLQQNPQSPSSLLDGHISTPHSPQISDQGTLNLRAILSPGASRQQLASIPARRQSNASNPISGDSRSFSQATADITGLVTSNSWRSDDSNFLQESAKAHIPGCVDTSVSSPSLRNQEYRGQEAAGNDAGVNRKKVEETAATKEKPLIQEDWVSSPAVHLGTDTGNQKLKKTSASTTTKESFQMPQASDSAQRSINLESELAAELRSIMDKMKFLKNRDPALFQRAWEELKQNSSSEPAKSLSMLSLKTSSNSILSDGVRQNAKPNQITGETSQSQIVTSAPVNGYPVIVEDNTEDLPDLGRFPAGRRIREQCDTTNGKASEKMAHTAPVHITTLNIFKSTDAAQKQPEPAPVPMNRPAPKRITSATIWPESKRNALAEAAIQTLNGTPENRAIGMTTDDIRAMLLQNPSYMDLCETLEKRGLRFHRNQFARQLLSSVPDLTASRPSRESQPPAPAFSPQPAASSVAPAHQHTIPRQDMQVSSKSPPVIRSQPVPGSIAPEAKPRQPQIRWTPINQGVPTPRRPRCDRTPLSIPAAPALPAPAAPPGSKEERAYKRHFSEIVDLTQLSDTEDYVMRTKKSRANSPSPDPDPFVAYEQSLATSTISESNHAPSILRHADIPSRPNQSHYPGPGVHGGIPKRERTILAKPLQRNQVLRKSYYNPKTVARDVLIAAGRHPSERPLNAHLAGMFGSYLELQSDLETIDWDALDPGGPKPPVVDFIDIPVTPPKFALGDKTRFSSHRRGRDLTKSRSAVVGEVGNAKPSHSSAVPLFSRFSAQCKQLLQNSEKLAKKPLQVPPQLQKAELVDADVFHKHERVVIPQKRIASPQLADDSNSGHRPSDSCPEISPTLTPSMDATRKRGRPPGSKNKQPTIAEMKRAATPVVIVPPPQAPPPTSFTVYKCKWRSCSAQLHNLPTLRAHIAKVHKPSTETVQEDGHICWWKNCRYLKQELAGTVRVLKSFDSHSDWLEHIENEHLHPLGMIHGDGPSTTHIGKRKLDLDLSQFLYYPIQRSVTRIRSHIDPQSLARDKIKFLSDPLNRITTPSAVSAANSDKPGDAMTLARATKDPDDLIPVKAFLKAHGNKKMDVRKSAEEVLRAMEVHKEKIGPGMDRGGCTLVTDARRATLVQDADMARVIAFDFE